MTRLNGVAAALARRSPAATASMSRSASSATSSAGRTRRMNPASHCAPKPAPPSAVGVTRIGSSSRSSAIVIFHGWRARISSLIQARNDQPSGRATDPGVPGARRRSGCRPWHRSAGRRSGTPRARSSRCRAGTCGPRRGRSRAGSRPTACRRARRCRSRSRPRRPRPSRRTATGRGRTGRGGCRRRRG